MRTTLDIPEELMSEAMKITKARNKTELIKYALRNIIQRDKLSGLKKYKGKVDLDIDLNALRKRNVSVS